VPSNPRARMCRVALVAISAAGLTMTAVLPAHAAVAPPEVVDTYATPVLVLGTAKAKDNLVAAAVRGATSVTVTADRATAGLCSSWGSPLGNAGPDEDDPTITDFGNYFTTSPTEMPRYGGNGCAGRWKLTYTARGPGGTATRVGYQYVQRASRFGALNAAPEPIARGTVVTSTALLQRASWATLKYQAWNTPVQLQFRTTGAWKTLRTLTPSSKGVVRGSVHQTVTGCWRMVVAGTSTTAGTVSSADCVTVR
jgi:hypothetical protein